MVDYFQSIYTTFMPDQYSILLLASNFSLSILFLDLFGKKVDETKSSKLRKKTHHIVVHLFLFFINFEKI